MNRENFRAIRLQSVNPNSIYVEARIDSVGSSEPGVIGKFDASGSLKSMLRHPTSSLVSIREGGWLWDWRRTTEKWKVYNPDGDLETVIPARGGFIGPDGNLYSPGETNEGQPIRSVVNRTGEVVDTLTADSSQHDPGTGFYRVDSIDFEDRTSVFRTGPTRKDRTGEYTLYGTYEMGNATVNISHMDRPKGTFGFAGSVRLPSVRTYWVPAPVDLPGEIIWKYPEELVQVQGDTLYALGFSLPPHDAEEKPQYHLVKVNLREYFWHERHHGPDYLKKYTALHEKSADELRLLRNEIFARYGYAFSSPELQQHFEQTDWYEPDPDFSADRLSEEETWLAQRIKELEEVKRDAAMEAEDAK